jgi:hypothetical protein
MSAAKPAEADSRRRTHPDFPTRAAEVFRDGLAVVEHEGVSVALQPFTIRRVALLHSVESPLYYPDGGRFGVGLGWMLTVYIMGTDAGEASELLAVRGPAGFALAALDWCDAMQDYELCALCGLAIQDAWERIMTLDPPDLMPKDQAAGGDAGNA